MLAPWRKTILFTGCKAWEGKTNYFNACTRYIEFDKSRNIFPTAPFKSEGDKAIAKKMWDWANEKINSNVIILRDDNYMDLLPHREWVISLYVLQSQPIASK